MPLLGIHSLRELRPVLPIHALCFIDGLSIGWNSPGSIKMATGEVPFPVSSEDVSWAVSLNDLGMLAGCVASSVVFARFGRRQTMSMAPLFYTVSMLLCCLARAAALVLAARFLAGMALAVGASFTNIYIAELMTSSARPTAIVLCLVFASTGVLLQYAAGPFLSFGAQALLPAPALALCALGMARWMEESPYFHAREGRGDEVLAVLGRLRPGVPAELVREEAAAISASVKQQQSESATWREALAAPGTRRAFATVVFVSCTGALFGVTTVVGFTAIIFRLAGAESESVLAVGMMVTLFVSNVLAVPVVTRATRKAALAGSLLGNALCLLGLGLFFLVRERARDAGTLDSLSAWTSWLPVGFLYGFMVTHSMGGIPVPSILTGELLPERLKPLATPVSMSLLSVTSFLVNKSFLFIGESIGFWLPFGIFAVNNLLGALLVMLVVPETKGKTLVEVQDMLRGRSSDKKEMI